MAKKPSAQETFTVTHSAPFEASGVPAGVVAIDDSHHLAVVSAEPAYAAKLDLAASMLNSSEEFLLNVPPPPDVQTRMQYRRTVARDAQDARDALLQILLEKYGFTLTPA